MIKRRPIKKSEKEKLQDKILDEVMNDPTIESKNWVIVATERYLALTKK